MVSVLDSGSNSLGLSPSRGHCVVFLGKALLSNEYWQIIRAINLKEFLRVTCDGLASHPGGVAISQSCFHATTELELSRQFRVSEGFT